MSNSQRYKTGFLIILIALTVINGFKIPTLYTNGQYDMVLIESIMTSVIGSTIFFFRKLL